MGWFNKTKLTDEQKKQIENERRERHMKNSYESWVKRTERRRNKTQDIREKFAAEHPDRVGSQWNKR